MPIISFRKYSVLGIFKEIASMSFESLLSTWTNSLMNPCHLSHMWFCQYNTNIQNNFRILSCAPISLCPGSDLILESLSLPSAVPSLIISLSSDSSRLVFSMLLTGSSWSVTPKLSSWPCCMFPSRNDVCSHFYSWRPNFLMVIRFMQNWHLLV